MRKAQLSSVGIDWWVYLSTFILLALFFTGVFILLNKKEEKITPIITADFDKAKFQAFLELPYKDEHYTGVTVWQAVASQAVLLDGQKSKRMELDAKYLNPLVCSMRGLKTCMWTLGVTSPDGSRHVLVDPIHARMGLEALSQTTTIPTLRGNVDVDLTIYSSVEDIDITLEGGGP